MGCLSSKIITRSMSIKELNQSMQKSANSLAVLEDLATSKDINNQLLALVGTSSRVASKLRSESFSKSCLEPEAKPSSPTNTTWEFSTVPEQEAQEKQGKPAALMILPQPGKGYPTKRSRSCHWFPGDSSLEKNEGVRRARSFHRIEEYDAMVVERIRLSMAEEIGSNGKEGSSTTNVHFGASQSSSHLSNHEMGDICIRETPESNSKGNDSLDEKSESKMEATSVSPGSKIENRMLVSNAKSANATEVLDVARHTSDEHALEEGPKRESVAEGLELLEVPQSIEFLTVASLREWLHASEVCSPGADVTRSLPNSGTVEECNDSAIFNPELVAAFEECMQQLEAEAETILNQIAENFEEELLMEK